jgi:hypothetical protein
LRRHEKNRPSTSPVRLDGAVGRTAKGATPQDTAEAIERHRRVLERTAKGAKILEQDLAPDSEAHNIEGSLHPEFLIEHTRCRDLSAAVDRCHQRAALVVCPKLESSRGGSEPVKDLRRLLDLLEGSCPPGNPAEPGRPSCLPLKAYALLVAGPADLGMMRQAEPAMPERFLWLAGGSGPRLGHGSASNASEDSSAARRRRRRRPHPAAVAKEASGLSWRRLWTRW